MRSEHFDLNQDDTPRALLEVEPVDPDFYKALVQAKDIGQILAEQMEPRGDDADPSACILLVSDTGLLQKLVTHYRSMAALSPPNASVYALDTFVQLHADPSLASAYWAVTRRQRITDCLFSGFR